MSTASEQELRFIPVKLAAPRRLLTGKTHASIGATPAALLALLDDNMAFLPVSKSPRHGLLPADDRPEGLSPAPPGCLRMVSERERT